MAHNTFSGWPSVNSAFLFLFLSLFFVGFGASDAFDDRKKIVIDVQEL